ncbi:MAG TPA: MOSC domain-containing protein [Acidimicrobiia bacterium]
MTGAPAIRAVVSVNVGRARPVQRNGKPATTAIWKQPVAGRVAARGVNLAGDEQADRSVHGGPSKAVYAYASEDTAWWEQELGRELGAGAFGENLTTTGIELSSAVIGEHWQVGSAVLAVTEPRLPCWKLGVRFGDPGMVRRFTRAQRSGAYLGIVAEGDLGAGDEIRVVERPAHGATVGDIWRIYHRDRARAASLLEVAELSEGWREWARAHAAGR